MPVVNADNMMELEHLQEFENIVRNQHNKILLKKDCLIIQDWDLIQSLISTK